jgi:hypothetical protein
MTNTDLLPVNRCDGPVPACQSFFEADFDLVSNIIAITSEEGVFFL